MYGQTGAGKTFTMTGTHNCEEEEEKKDKVKGFENKHVYLMIYY